MEKHGRCVSKLEKRYGHKTFRTNTSGEFPFFLTLVPIDNVIIILTRIQNLNLIVQS